VGFKLAPQVGLPSAMQPGFAHESSAIAHGIRTNTAALTERHPAVRSPRILKWWSRTVMLRLLLGAARCAIARNHVVRSTRCTAAGAASQPCSLLHYGPFEIGGRDGCRPRCLLPDKEASLLLLFTTEKLDAGDGVAPTKTGL